MPTKHNTNPANDDEEDESEGYTVNKGAKKLWDLSEEEVEKFFQGGEGS